MTLPERRKVSRPSWSPLNEFEDAYDRMGRLFRDVFGDFGERRSTWSMWGSPLDLEETDDEYIVEIDLPGVKKDDLTVEVSGREIHVRGEIKERERTGVLRRQTRQVGVVEHRFTLPGEFDAAAVRAELSDGVLTLRVPKTQVTKPQVVEVKVR